MKFHTNCCYKSASVLLFWQFQKQFNPLNWIEAYILSLAIDLQSWIEGKVGAKLQLSFCYRFNFISGWFNSHVSMMWKCCLLEARGASFLTSLNVNYLASVAFKFVRFPRAFIISNLFMEQESEGAFFLFLERFCEVSRAVNFVT